MHWASSAHRPPTRNPFFAKREVGVGAIYYVSGDSGVTTLSMLPGFICMRRLGLGCERLLNFDGQVRVPHGAGRGHYDVGAGLAVSSEVRGAEYATHANDLVAVALLLAQLVQARYH